jgi:hypothetical protein
MSSNALIHGSNRGSMVNDSKAAKLASSRHTFHDRRLLIWARLPLPLTIAACLFAHFTIAACSFTRSYHRRLHSHACHPRRLLIYMLFTIATPAPSLPPLHLHPHRGYGHTCALTTAMVVPAPLLPPLSRHHGCSCHGASTLTATAAATPDPRCDGSHASTLVATTVCHHQHLPPLPL